MSVTIIKQPYPLIPAYNDIEFLASSTAIASGNFNYYVKVTVDSDEYIYRIPPDENNQGYFNLRRIAEKYVQNYYPFGLDGWQGFTQTNNIGVVNIGEEYGSTPVIYPGSNINVVFWNAALTIKARSTYISTDVSPTSANLWLNSIGEFRAIPEYEKAIYSYQDLVFYFINLGNLDKVIFQCYDVFEGGSVLYNQFTINAPSDVFSGLNCSPASINALEVAVPGICVGSSHPTPFGNGENYYKVTFSDNANSKQSIAAIKILDQCNGLMEDVVLHYQNHLGAFDSIILKQLKKSIDVNRDFYRGISPRFEASHLDTSTPTNGSNPLSISKKVLSPTYEENKTLISDWLTQTEIDNLQDLFTSSFLFLQTGYADYQRIQVSDLKYDIRNKAVERLVQIQVNINSGVTERRQYE